MCTNSVHIVCVNLQSPEHSYGNEDKDLVIKIKFSLDHYYKIKIRESNTNITLVNIM